MKIKTVLFCVALIAVFTVNADAAPQIGDKAPPIKIAKWLSDAPPALPGEKNAEKHIYLVEFWATWCGPCRLSIPHLAELHRKHEKDGLVILGISNEEPETIKAFMTMKMKDAKSGETKTMDMPYFVGSDDDMATQAIWLKDIPGIPHAFIVDRDGIVVWSGNPLNPDDKLDETLEKVLAGKYNVEAAKQKAATDKKYSELYEELKSAYRMKDGDKVFKILDEMISLQPKELHPYMIKRQLLAEFDRAGEIAAWNDKILESFKDVPAGLRQFVMEEMAKPVEERDAQLIVKAAAAARTAAENGDTDAAMLLATVQHECGLLEAAIATLEKALENADGEAKAAIKATLTYYRAFKKLAKKHKLAGAKEKA